MRKINVIIFCVCFALTIGGYAAATEITGVGTAKCSEFVRAYQSAKTTTVPVYLAWAQGFMSSLNMGRSQRKLPTRSFDSKSFPLEKQVAFLLAYCKQNPTRDFTAATITLYGKLPKQ